MNKSNNQMILLLKLLLIHTVVIKCITSFTIHPKSRSFTRSISSTSESLISNREQRHRQLLYLSSQTISSPSSTSSTSIGDADRSFQLGSDLEKKGLARAASASFHEAATLYQCFIDNYDYNDSSSNEFGHVTTLNPEQCTIKLAYACIRLAHLSHDVLGDSNAAIRLYKEAISIDPICPSSISYDGIGTSIEASGNPNNLHDAVDAYRSALKLHISPSNDSMNYDVLFHLAVALERLEETEESNEIMEKLRRCEISHSCLVDSWGYVRWHTRNVKTSKLNLHRGTQAMLQLAIDAASDLIFKSNGLICEYGVGSGRSLRMIHEMLPLNIPIYGFDTFEGLPIAWNNEPIGTYSTGGVMPNDIVNDGNSNVNIYKGLFSDTIPTFLNDTSAPLAFANIDCDLYTSTYDILESMHSRIVPGTVIIFDEYICHPTWRHDEFRAWRECCKRFGWQYEYLAFSLSTKQAIVRVT